MIRYFCDMCMEERNNEEIFGVNYAEDETICLTKSGDLFKSIGECKTHICKKCLKVIGWKENPEQKEQEENGGSQNDKA